MNYQQPLTRAAFLDLENVICHSNRLMVTVDELDNKNIVPEGQTSSEQLYFEF